MEQEGRATSINRSEKTVVRDPEKTMAAPRFDEKSIRKARPAVPLGRVRSRLPRTPILFALAAILLGVVAGVVGMSLYQSRRAEQRTVATVEPAPDETASATVEAQPEVAPTEESQSVTDAGELSTPDAIDASDDQAALNSALGQWIEATNARDIGRQMDFYNPRLDAFYLSRNASARDVRAEKERIFRRAEQVVVEADGPAAIHISPDGRTATMRFRKHYQIEGEGVDRRGAVMQELRWRKTDKGWKIVSERDLRVLN